MIALHFVPLAVHRCQRNAYESAEPLTHLPRAAARTRPTRATPVTFGFVVLTGRDDLVAASVSCEEALIEPELSVAVTVTRSWKPTSALTTLYVARVAPLMVVQVSGVLQRAQAYA